jgi:hypothetical protein
MIPEMVAIVPITDTFCHCVIDSASRIVNSAVFRQFILNLILREPKVVTETLFRYRQEGQAI